VERHRRRNQLALGGGLGWWACLAALPVALVLLSLLAAGAVRPSAGADARAWEGQQDKAGGPRCPGVVERLRTGDTGLAGTLQTRRVAGDVVSVARQELASYRERGLVLVESGWLDLSGNVWGCVVFSGAWSEVCLVSGDAGGAWSEVRAVRIAAQDQGGTYVVRGGS